MADHEPQKDFIKVDPDHLDLTIKGEPPEVLPGSSESEAHYSGKPTSGAHSARLPEVEPDNMPGDTEIETKTTQQRY